MRLKKRAKLGRPAVFQRILLIFVLLLSCGFSVLLLAMNLKINYKRRFSSSELEISQAQLESALKEREDWQAEFSEESRAGYLEREARENFSFKKPGEKVVAFPIVDSD